MQGGFAYYSGVPITWAGCNKQAGWIFHEISWNEQVVLSKQGGIFEKFLKNKQAAIRHEQGAFEDYFTTYSKISIISTVLLKILLKWTARG